MTPEMVRLVEDKSVLGIALAGLEDAIFVLPLLLAPKIRIVRLAAISIMTYSFCRGHDYQGMHAMIAKAPYVPVAYYFASHYGILTTIIPHALHDMWALSVLKTRLWWERRKSKIKHRPIRILHIENEQRGKYVQ
jgi:hypothetical protein